MGAGSAWRGNTRGVAEAADGIDGGHHADGLDISRVAHATGQPAFVKTSTTPSHGSDMSGRGFWSALDRT